MSIWAKQYLNVYQKLTQTQKRKINARKEGTIAQVNRKSLLVPLHRKSVWSTQKQQLNSIDSENSGTILSKNFQSSLIKIVKL